MNEVKMNTRIVYYVEGETEETFIGSLKGEMSLILPGRIRVFNVVNKPLSNFIRRGFSQNEIAVFVFDTDTGKIEILEQNISMLEIEKKRKKLKDYLFILQVPNLEGELIRSCSKLSKIKDFFSSNKDSDFKPMMAQAKSLKVTLERHGFDFGKLWILSPTNEFARYKNGKKQIVRKNNAI